jgi:asparagine synthase (glutamine-hydrolysing)
MCGIVGIYSTNSAIDGELIRKMNDAIYRRGPDDEGYYLNNHINLGMRRLSIIDISAGHQPIYNEDGSVVIVFNGEIYNHNELRVTLISQ